jgi:tetratricopeptide (TPR) repeat protein/tRNA A-37 threonylcarbamoyl transferase component Bud32
MGAVYLASRADEAFQKRVAIKLLRRGTHDETLLRRFQNERQILADLEHPNIARLIDGGSTENGLPYFVMEYVEGLPVDRYCDESGLDVGHRLDLFRQICSAVEFAHSHSIVHRDIKPSNILVTREGVPKLLDFGIAKSFAGNDPTPSTATALRVMTPEYASPEQMRGLRVTGSSDVYSLGVLLYELLTRRRPYDFDSKSPYEIVQAICEDEPIALRQVSLSRDAAFPWSVPDDLENITLKALRKEPERRYSSVREFSEDLERYQGGRPVLARPDSLFYVGRKFVKRHKTALAAAFAILFISSIAGVGLSYFRTWAPAVPTLNDRLTDNRLGGSRDAGARDLYVQARVLWEQRTKSSVEASVGLFQQAIDRDPDFSLAYSGLANGCFLSSVWGDMTPDDAFSRAREASLKAIALAPGAAEGHLSLAVVHWQYDFDWPSADREFRTAIELDPSYARAPHWYGLFLGEMGRFDEAIAAEQRAIELEPESMPVKADYARVLYYARRYDESLAQYQMILRMAPAYSGVYEELREFYEDSGMLSKWFVFEETIGGGDLPKREAYRTGGYDAYLRKMIEEQERDGGRQTYYALAQEYAFLRQNDKAIALLYKALEVHDHRFAQLRVLPKFDNIRDDPRFVDLMRRLNLS